MAAINTSQMDRDIYLDLFSISVRNYCYYYFQLEINFYFIQYNPTSFLSLHSFQFQIPSSLDPLTLPFVFRKEQISKRGQPNRTKQNTLRQGESLHIHAEQDNSVGERGFQQQAEESEAYLLSHLGVPQKSQANNHYIYQVDTVQNMQAPKLDASVSVNPCEPCLVIQWYMFFLFTSLPSPSSKKFPDLLGEGPHSDVQFRLSLGILICKILPFIGRDKAYCGSTELHLIKLLAKGILW